MKRILSFVFLFLLFAHPVEAHPLDISASFFSFDKNYLNITTYFHSYEIEYLLAKNGIQTKSVYEYYEHEDIIKKYLHKAIALKSGNEYCQMGDIDILQLEEYQILSKGMEINYHFICKENIKSGQIEVHFFDNFPLQTNQITLYNLNDSSVSSAPMGTSVLNTQVKIYSFDLEKNFKKCRVDSDGDGISDQEERIYKTDIQKIDSDGDYYTDYEEIYNSWLPLDKNMGPKQEARMEIPSYILENIAKSKKTNSDCEKQKTQVVSGENGLLSKSFGNTYFVNMLEDIGKYVKGKSENHFFYILLGVIGLGFIHALGPGHSKSLLISYILDKHKSFFDGLLYITIFTFTHLIDIILLFLITKIFFNFYDISNYMLLIQRISILILLFFSLYLIIRAWKNKNNISSQDQGTSNNMKGTFFLGFVSGLAPCTFGWSIFLLLFSLGSFDLIIPLILALGIGIFLCLLFVMIITFILRKKVFEKISVFSKYSSVFSSSVLFVLGLYLAFQLF